MMPGAWTAAACGLLLLFAGCAAATPKEPEPIRIGALYPLSGTQGRYGAEEMNGVEVAVAMFNARGGVRGRPVRLDTRNAPSVDAAWREAHRLARSGVPAIIGSYGSTLSIAASEVAHREGVLYWETGAVADLVTARGYPEVFRTGPSGATLAAQAASFAVSVVGPRYGIPARSLRVAVVYENDPYGGSVGEGIKHEAARRRFPLVGAFPYDPSTENFRGIIRDLRRARPDVVVAATYLDDGARFRKAVLDARLPLKALIGKCAAFYTPEMAALLGSSINGVFVADKPRALAPSALLPEARALEREMRSEFLERYGRRPDAAAYMGFSGAWVLFQSVLGTSPSLSLHDLRRTALAVDLPDGSLPNGAGVRFSPPGGAMTGQNLRALGVVWQWQKGRPVLVYPPAAARGAAVFGAA